MEYFYTQRKGNWGEEARPFKTRRDQEYEKLTEESDIISLSKKLANFFMLDGFGLSEAEHLDVLK